MRLLIPGDCQLSGAKDPAHLRQAVRESAALLSHNFDDFRLLHDLVLDCPGHHSGVLIVRKDDDPKRDMQPPHIVRAIRNFTAAGVPVTDHWIILNHWR